MFYEHKHELVFALDGRKVSDVAHIVRYVLWTMFADKANIFGQKVAMRHLIVEVRTDYPDDARMSVAAAAIYYMLQH